MSKQNIIGRYTLFLIGLFIASMGVAFSTKAGLGTSPVASVPYSVSRKTGRRSRRKYFCSYCRRQHYKVL